MRVDRRRHTGVHDHAYAQGQERLVEAGEGARIWRGLGQRAPEQAQLERQKRRSGVRADCLDDRVDRRRWELVQQLAAQHSASLACADWVPPASEISMVK